jgi:hypothetical protein
MKAFLLLKKSTNGLLNIIYNLPRQELTLLLSYHISPQLDVEVGRGMVQQKDSLLIGLTKFSFMTGKFQLVIILMVRSKLCRKMQLHQFRQVKNNADVEQSKTGQFLTYDKYLNLLSCLLRLHMTTSLHQRNQNGMSLCIALIILMMISTMMTSHTNIDAPVSNLLANSTERRNKSFGSNIKNGVRMQRDKWFNLDTKSKEIWDQ